MNSFKAGNLKNFKTNWQKITSNEEILNQIEGTTLPFLENPKQYAKLNLNPKFSDKEAAAIDKEIAKLVQKEVIKECQHEKDEFISPIFVTPKRDGGYRLILNLKKLNENLEYIHFKMHGLQEILRLVERNCFMASLDIKDAYYSVPVEESFQKYLKFYWKGKLYKFCVLPNGLAPCPRWFTKLLKPPLAKLRERKHDLSAYIDDIYLQGRSESECTRNILDSIMMMRSLGFTIHAEKSKLIPSTKLEILGFEIDSVRMRVSLTHAKKDEILVILKKVKNKTYIKIRKLAQLIGKIVASFPGSMYGPLFYRNLELNKQIGLKESKDNYEGYVKINSKSKKELNWWELHLPTMYKNIKQEPACMVIYTDASNKGWGAICDKAESGGNWALSEQKYHINIKEMLAVLFGLKCFASEVSNISIQLNIDNTSVVSVLKNMGTSHNKKLNKICKTIWCWCMERRIWIYPVYVSSDKNLADKPSRKLYAQGEWMLAKEHFQKIETHFGVHFTIDLFASRINKQLSQYVSFKPDPNAIACDAFTLNWSDHMFYCFPPFSCISRCLQKIQEDKATGVIVAPKWPTQPFYSKLMKMLVTKPLILIANHKNLILPQNPDMKSQIAEKTSLMICHVSGKDF